MVPAETRYNLIARMMHWTMAVLILAMIPVGWLMTQSGLERSLQNTLFIFHKNVGVALLVLIALRLAYRLTHKPAPLPSELPGWQHRAASLSHLTMYALLIIMPVAGYIRVKAGGFPIEALDALGVPALVMRSDALAEFAKSVHYFGGYTLTGLVALHIGAALYHGLVRRDGVLGRMWPPFGAPKE